MIRADHVREILCFGMVGVAATAVHYLIALLSIETFHLSVYISNLTGYLCALGVSYFGHGLVTFRAPLNYRVFRRFAVVSVATFCTSELLLAALEELLQLPHRIAMAVVVLFVPVVSFGLNKFWVYRHTPVNAS